MKAISTKKETVYSAFAWCLFGSLFVYLLLRAYFVEPIHDEVATFFYYIETGVFWGDQALLDANNHLLNSFISRKLFLLFGPDFFFLRLPNVLAFGVFFWSLYQLVLPIKNLIYRFILLVSLTGIPFILEYFAYTRGYGISLAFFLGAIVFLKRFVSSYSWRSLFVAYFFLTVAVYSNLTYLVSCILTIVFIILHQFLNRKELSWKKQLSFFLFHSALLISIRPAINFAEKLKEGGALYYGSLDGFWEITGKTLTQYTLFFTDNWFKWCLLLVFILLVILLIRLWFKKGVKIFFQSKEAVIAWFLFGHIIAILFLAHFRDVNYPEDRVGMYLIPLTLLLVAYLLNNNKWSSYGSFAFIIFPILFIPRINLTTSVFSPDDRLSNDFYNPISKDVDAYSTISVYPLMRLNWAFQNRKQKTQNTVSDFKVFNTAADYVLTKQVLKHNPSVLANYDTISQDNNSGYIAYKRKVPFIKSVIFDSTFNLDETDNEFIGLGAFTIPDSLRNRKLQIHADGEITTNATSSNLNIVYSTFDDKTNMSVYESWNLRWSFGLKSQFLMNFNYPIDSFEPKDYEVRVYLWNQMKEKISIKNGKFELIILE